MIRKILIISSFILLNAAFSFSEVQIILKPGYIFFTELHPKTVERQINKAFPYHISPWTTACEQSQFYKIFYMVEAIYSWNEFISTGYEIGYIKIPELRAYYGWVEGNYIDVRFPYEIYEEFDIIPMSVMMKYNFYRHLKIYDTENSRFNLFSGFGLDYFIWKYKHEYYVNYIDGDVFDQVDENGGDFGCHLLVGVDYKLNDHWFLYGETKYLWLKGKLSDKFHADYLDFSGPSVSIGMKYQF